MRVKAPSDVVEYIREKFTLSMGKVIKHDGTVPSFTIINKRNYSTSYIKDVLENKDPDLSVLFDVVDGQLFRNQDSVWSIYKGKRLTSNGAKVCGVLVTPDGIKELPDTPKLERATKPAEAALSINLETIVVPEHIKEIIKDRFHISDGKVVYKRLNKPFGSYAVIDGMHYSYSYVQQVLEDKNPDISNLFEERDGYIYRSQDPIWGSFRGRFINTAKVCGVAVEQGGFKLITKAPEPIVLEAPSDDYYSAIEVPEHIKMLIKSKFKLVGDEVQYKYDEQKKLAFAVLADNRYSYSYVLAVLKGEKPNLESLFTIKDGYRYRNDDPVWQKYKGTKVGKTSSICGEIVPGKVSAPSIPRPDDFAWLADMEKKDSPIAKFAYSYQGGEPALLHRVKGIIYSAGFIDRLKSGEVITDRPPIPAILFRRVRLDFGDGSYVTMTSDDDVWRTFKLREILEEEEYLINGFLYSGKEIIEKSVKSKVWSWEEFYRIAKALFPNNDVVANIKLDDSEITGEM